jgi:hypothetical protein
MCLFATSANRATKQLKLRPYQCQELNIATGFVVLCLMVLMYWGCVLNANFCVSGVGSYKFVYNGVLKFAESISTAFLMHVKGLPPPPLPHVCTWYVTAVCVIL